MRGLLGPNSTQLIRIFSSMWVAGADVGLGVRTWEAINCFIYHECSPKQSAYALTASALSPTEWSVLSILSWTKFLFGFHIFSNLTIKGFILQLTSWTTHTTVNLWVIFWYILCCFQYIFSSNYIFLWKDPCFEYVPSTDRDGRLRKCQKMHYFLQKGWLTSLMHPAHNN